MERHRFEVSKRTLGEEHPSTLIALGNIDARRAKDPWGDVPPQFFTSYRKVEGRPPPMENGKAGPDGHKEETNHYHVS